MKVLKEDSLLPIITNTNLFGKGLLHTRELSSGYGIADIVFYSLNKNVVKQRWQENIDPIDSYDIINVLTKLNQLEQESVSLTFLTEAFPSLRRSRREVVTYLVEKGFLVPDRKGSKFHIRKSYQVGLQKVVAVEAKLSNWKRGLYQAYRYKEYANRSYLALYSKYIHRAIRHIGEFKRFNIGLIEVKDDTAQIIFDPTSERIKENIYSAVVYEELLRLNEHFSPNP